VIAFFDASALIYLVESKEPFSGRVRRGFSSLVARNARLGSAVSRLTLLECRVGPVKNNDAALLASFDAFFARRDLFWVELTKDVVELATLIRVKHGLRTPDALQAAACLQLGPDHIFLTGDAAFRRVSGLMVKVFA
jgi:predicted nucleic acid-binding protein